MTPPWCVNRDEDSPLVLMRHASDEWAIKRSFKTEIQHHSGAPLLLAAFFWCASDSASGPRYFFTWLFIKRLKLNDCSDYTGFRACLFCMRNK
jgi:hypothetical protein